MLLYRTAYAECKWASIPRSVTTRSAQYPGERSRARTITVSVTMEKGAVRWWCYFVIHKRFLLSSILRQQLSFECENCSNTGWFWYMKGKHRILWFSPCHFITDLCKNQPVTWTSVYTFCVKGSTVNIVSQWLKDIMVWPDCELMIK